MDDVSSSSDGKLSPVGTDNPCATTRNSIRVILDMESTSPLFPTLRSQCFPLCQPKSRIVSRTKSLMSRIIAREKKLPSTTRSNERKKVKKTETEGEAREARPSELCNGYYPLICIATSISRSKNSPSFVVHAWGLILMLDG